MVQSFFRGIIHYYMGFSVVRPLAGIKSQVQTWTTCWTYVSVVLVDNKAPVISNCPNSVNNLVSCGVPSGTVTWIPPTATDNSGGIPAVSSTYQPGASFPVGTTPVTYTFTDSAGNQAQCSFAVTGNCTFLRRATLYVHISKPVEYIKHQKIIFWHYSFKSLQDGI